MKRVLSLLVFGTAIAAGTEALAADVCIDDKAKQSLNACAGGVAPKEFKGSKTPTTNFHSAPQQADLKKKDQQTKPGKPNVDEAPRDERKSRLQARQRALLVTEIQGLERLFETTAKNKPDRPQLARRLAEAYVELESAAFRDKTQAEIKRDELKKSNPQAAGQQQTQANQAYQVMKAARKKAIDNYTIIVNEYPTYSQLDEVLYYLAYEYEQANDLANARKVYYDLIKKAPQSKYIPNAYLAFGELFFNEAQGDPSKWDLAAQAYTEVTKYPAPANKVYGYAWYKLGYVYWNKGELEKSLNAFKKTIEFGVVNSQLPGASKLADSARRDVIPVYALKGDPAQAYNFFHNISGDQGSSNTQTYKMMDDLGVNYLDTGHYPEAITLYRDLLTRDRGGRQCVYQAHITEATMAMKSNDKEKIVKEIDQQVKLHNEVKAGGFSAEQKQECANKTAALTTETAMAWHLEAVGSNGQRGTGDNKTMALAAQLYKKVVDTWNAEEYSKFEFPRIVKEDWPTIYKIKYAMADLLYFQKDWAKCGPAFDAVVQENPAAPEAAESAYAAVLCYQNIYEETHKNGEAKKGSGNLPGQKGEKLDKKAQAAQEAAALKPKDMTESQKGMVSAFNKYICYIKPAAGDAAGQDQLVEVKYARARTYFEAQHWDEAGAGFRDIAMNHADKDVGIYAAQLYLESVNVLGSHMGKTSCYDDMEQDVPKFIELYCSGANAQKNGEQCTTLNKIQVDLLRLKAQELVKAADKNGGKEALSQYEKGGTAYYEMFRRYCQDPVNNGQQPQAEKCDEIAYNAAKSFQAARLIAKAITARRALLAYDEKTKGNSPLAKKATYEIGGNYQAIAVYDQAAEWYEKYAKADPNGENADKGLADAVVLRLGLGQENEAIADAATFNKQYGAKKPAQTAQIAFAIGAHYADQENWAKARDALTGSMSTIDRAAPDIQVQAHATLARSYDRMKAWPLAKTEYGKVRGFWSNPGDAEAKIRNAYPGEDKGQQDRRLAKALNAVGEALFYSAEEQRKATVEPLKFPVYSGPGDKASVMKHISTKVKDWYMKKQAAILKAEPEYVKILDLKPEAPPKWVIAAGSRAGLMWGDLVDDFRAAPIPAAWKKDPEIRGTYYDALDAASEPYKSGRAKPALKKCLDLSVKYQYFDEYSRACEVWLAKNYKAEYHVVDELRGAPTLSNSGLDEKAPPVLPDGTFWHPQGPAPEKNAAGTAEKGDETSGGGEKPAAKPAGGGGGGGGGKKQGGGRPLPGGKKK
jgi:tetratricopeptide (TPR) repeat protein